MAGAWDKALMVQEVLVQGRCETQEAEKSVNIKKVMVRTFG